jgi:hypothetical protein
MINETSIKDSLTEKWMEERLGKFTSSKLGVMLKDPRNKALTFNEGAITHIYAKIGETLTGERNEIGGAAIAWGEEHEEDALRVFADMSGFDVTSFGKNNPIFFPYPKEPDHAGGSPDGMIYNIKIFELIGRHGVPGDVDPEHQTNLVIEVKCPYESKYHAEVLHKTAIGAFDLQEYDSDYYAQVQGNILFTGAIGAFFVSYDPRCQEYRYSLTWSYVPRDEEAIKKIEDRLAKAIEIKRATLSEIGFYQKTKAA